MPGFDRWTPEQRAAAQAKAKETRDRKRAAKDAGKAQREAKPRRTPSISKRQVEHGIAALVTGIDAGLAYLIPQNWVTPDDRLNEQEVAILTEAFSTEAMKSPRALRFFAALTDLTGRLGILGALMIVALPRLTRRGLIPRQWVPILRDLIGAASAKEAEAPPEPEIPVREEPSPDREAA